MFIEVETITGVRTVNADYIVQVEPHPENKEQAVIRLSTSKNLYATCNYEELKNKLIK